MPSKATFLVLLCAACACVSQGPARPQGPVSAARRDPQTLEAQVQALEQASTPGPEHRELDRFAGVWELTLAAVAPDGSETTLASGDALIGWVLDGRYLRWDAGLGIAGKRRDTSGFLGFDRRARQHVLLTVTSLSTGMSVARGTGDPVRGGIRFTLEQVDPESGTTLRMTSVVQSLDADHFVLEQLGSDGVGGERVLQRSHYRRAVTK